MQFKANSGNTAEITVYRKGTQVAVDVSWDTPPSAEDIAGCNTWFAAQPWISGIRSRIIQDPDARERAIRQHLVAGEN